MQQKQKQTEAWREDLLCVTYVLDLQEKQEGVTQPRAVVADKCLESVLTDMKMTQSRLQWGQRQRGCTTSAGAPWSSPWDSRERPGGPRASQYWRTPVHTETNRTRQREGATWKGLETLCPEAEC